MINAGLIIAYTGSHANIPTGWERDTRFDGRIPQHSPAGVGELTGTATHEHTDYHTHSMSDHTHTTSLGASTGDTRRKHVDHPAQEYAARHTHSDSQSGAATVLTTGGASSVGEANSLPASHKVIYIRATRDSHIPAGGVVFRQDKNTPLSEYTAAYNRFLVGASTGEDAGANVGSDAHTHTWSHTHSAAHSHATTNSGNAPSGSLGADSGSESYAGWNHTHPIYYQTASLTTPATTLTTNSVSHVPIYRELYAFRATSQSSLHQGDIVITTGDVPTGWTLLSQDTFYVRVGAGATLESGGNHTHTHVAISHTHTSLSHTHTASCGGESRANSSLNTNKTSESYVAETNHTHVATVANSELTFGTSNTSISAITNVPPTIVVKYIVAGAGAAGGNRAAVLLPLIH